MRIKNCIDKIRMWGWRGIRNYLTDYLYRLKVRHFLSDQYRRCRQCEPECGITLIGNFTQQNSHSKTFRDFAWNLKEAGIPVLKYGVGFLGKRVALAQ